MKLFIRRTNSWLVCLLIVVLSLPTPSLAADKRNITETDLFKFVWIADPQISPDGSRVAFVRAWVNQKADRYDSALWVVPTNGGEARQLTAGPRDTSPRGRLVAARSERYAAAPRYSYVAPTSSRGPR